MAIKKDLIPSVINKIRTTFQTGVNNLQSWTNPQVRQDYTQNVLKPAISNQLNIQKRDFNQNVIQPIQQHPILGTTMNWLGEGAMGIKRTAKGYGELFDAMRMPEEQRKIRMVEMSKEYTPSAAFKDMQGIGKGALAGLSLLNPATAIKSTLTGSLLSGGMQIGGNIIENKRRENLAKTIQPQSYSGVPLWLQEKYNEQLQAGLQPKKITEGLLPAMEEGASRGLAMSGTITLTNALTEHLAKSIPALQKLTESSIQAGSPMAGETLKQTTRKFFDTAGKELLKRSVLETIVETPIWSALRKEEQNSWLETIQQETIENLMMNTAFAGLDILGDSTKFLPFVKDAINKSIYNPDGSIKVKPGGVQVGKPDMFKSKEELSPIKTGGVGGVENYRSTHQIDLSNTTDISNIDINSTKEEIRKLNGYISNRTLSDIKKLEKIQGNPEADVKIYRASPVNELNDGDWVTTNKEYANNIKQQNGGKVYEYTVKAKDLRYPKDIETLPSLARASAFSYSPKTTSLPQPIKTGGDALIDKKVDLGFSPTESKILDTPKATDTSKLETDIKEQTELAGDLSKNQSQLIIADDPYLDAKGELQFPSIDSQFKSYIGEGRPVGKGIFDKPDLDISKSGIEKGSILGGAGEKASPEVKEFFASWVNARRAAQVEGIIKSNEFKNLDNKGIEGIFEFQAGNKSGEFKELRKYFDDKFKQAQEAGIKLNYKDDYLPQMWKNNREEVSRVFGNRLGMRPSFTIESLVEDYKTGIENGLEPKYTRMSDIIASYEANVNKAIANKGFFDGLKTSNLILPYSKAPQDWVTLDPDRFPRLSFSTDEGKYTGIYKAPKDLGEMINNYLSNPSSSPNVALRGLNTLANWTSTVKNRVLSFGIPGTAINAHGFNILARNVMSSRNPLEGAITGIKYMINPNSARQELEVVLKDAPEAVKNGLTLSANEFKGVLDSPQGFRSKFGDVWNKLFEKGLFDKMLPALKLQKYQEVKDGFIKGGMSESEAGKQAAKFINTTFGGMNWEALGKSRDLQNVKRILILAPDWLETNIKLAGRIPKSFIKLGDKTLAPYRKFAATFLGSYIIMNIVNKLSSGHFMWDNDPGNTFNIEAGYTSDGKKRYIRPFGTAADFIRIPFDVISSLFKGDLQAPARVIRNRLSIPLGVVSGVFSDTDYTGQPIGYKGRDKYGNEIPIGQRAFGVGGEVATLLGMPAFVKQWLDRIGGKTGTEEALLQGFELPLRYGGGAYTKTQKTISDILKEQGASGEELYNANQSIRGLSFSKNEIEKIKTGGLEEFNKQVERKTTNKQLKEKLEGDGYYQSADSPQGLFGKTGLYIQAVITDPKLAIDAVFAGNPIRKVENKIVVLERKQGLGQLDGGDTRTEVDHTIPLSLGGTNHKDNLLVLSKEEHAIKTKHDRYLLDQVKKGNMTRKEAQEKAVNWRQEVAGLPIKIQREIVDDIAKIGAKEDAGVSGNMLDKIDKISDMPTQTAYQRALKEREAFKLVDDVMDNLSGDEQINALKALGITGEDATYYNTARQENYLKSIYVEEEIMGMIKQGQSKDQILNTLAGMRRAVNEKILLSDGVIKDLVDKNIISYQDGQMLKNIGKDLKPKGVKAKKPKKISLSSRKFTASRKKFNPLKVKTSSTKSRFTPPKYVKPNFTTSTKLL